MTKKLILSLIAVCLAITMFLPFVGASVTGNLNLSISGSPIKASFTQYTNSNSGAIYQTFIHNTESSDPLISASFWCKRSGDTAGWLIAMLEPVTSHVINYNTLNNLYAGSYSNSTNHVEIADIPESDWVKTTWYFDGEYEMQTGVTYAMLILCLNKTEASGDYINFNLDLSAGFGSGLYGLMDDGTWDISATYDFNFMINDEEPEPTPTPTPTPSPTPTSAPTATPPPSTFSVYLTWIIWLIILAGFITLAAVIVYSKNRRDNR